MRSRRAGARTLARVSALFMAYAVLLGLTLLAPTAWVPQAQAAEAGLSIHVSTVRPAIAGPGVDVQVMGTLTNPGTEPASVHSVRVSTARRGLDTRESVAAWAQEGGGETPVVLAEDQIASMVAPGAQVTFFAQIPADTIDPGFDFATLPVRIELMADPDGGDPTQETPQVGGELRTFLPWRAAEPDTFNPIEVAWVAPLTLPGGPDLVAADASTRDTAWSAAIGPSSRTTALLDGLADTQATFMVDPALLEPLDPVTSLTDGILTPGEEAPTAPSPTAPSTSESTEVPEPPTSTSRPPAGTPPAATPPAATPQAGSSAEPTGASTSDPTGAGAGPATGDTSSPGGPPNSPGAATSPDATEVTSPNASEVTDPGSPEETPPPIVPSTPVATEAAVLALAERLEQVSPERLWWLPVGDTDVGALLDLGVEPQAVADLVARPPAPAADLPGRADVSWPLSTDARDALISSLADIWVQAGDAMGAQGHGGGSLAGVVLPGAVLTDERLTSTAIRAHTSGPLLIGYDERLSGIVAASEEPGQDGPSVQRFLAESLAIYQEQPAADRSLVVALPRSATPSAETLRALTSAGQSAPWLSETSLDSLMGQASGEAPLTLPARPGSDSGAAGQEGDPGTNPPQAPGTGLAAYSIPGDSPLTPHRVTQLEQARERLVGASQIVPGSESSLATWQRVLDRQYSARWRQDDTGWGQQTERASALSAEILTGLHINPTTINFLADEGLIRITVTNDLPVPIEGLTMNVSPGNARLRVLAQPEPITIGPQSRATVQFRARAIAAGQVPLNTTLTTPNGTLVGEVERTQVRVQPTGVWIYWLLGGVAGVILVLGLVRALRPRPRGAAGTASPDTNVAASEPDTEHL